MVETRELGYLLSGDRFDWPEVRVSILESLTAHAKDALLLRDASGRTDLWLWEHSQRVANLAQMLAQLPEVAANPPDLTCLAAACLFHDAGWAVQVRQGQVNPWQVLSRPTSDIQRELGAGALQETLGKLLPRESAVLAAEAIRQCNDRKTELPEAQVLAEAENLDEIGLLYVLRQFRQYQAEGRPLEQLLISWSRQKEYHYWDARINECLRFEGTRQIARVRLDSVEQFMAALASDRDGADLRRLLDHPASGPLPTGRARRGADAPR